MEPNHPFICNLCYFTAHDFGIFQNHYIRMHKDDPNFFVACDAENCGYTTNKWGNFRTHFSRNHRHTRMEATDMYANMEVDNEDSSISTGTDFANAATNPFNAQTQELVFTLSLEGQHNVSQTSINKIVSSAGTLLQRNLSAFKDTVKKRLSERGIADIDGLLDDIPVENFLDQLDTSKKRLKCYMKSDSIPYIAPESIELNRRNITKNGQIVEVPNFGYYIPLEQSLHNLLELPEVWNYVQHPHFSSNEDYMQDFCDGEFFQTHPLFIENKTALQLILNTDDLEITNPLGSHTKKHKISIFYYTLGNIPPEHRSKLQVIQLIGIAKTQSVRTKGSLNTFLSDFISVVNKLSTEGLTFKLYGEDVFLKGTLVFVPADTLASNWLGGFKEGVGFARKNCRNCDISAKKLSLISVDHQVTHRDEDLHRAQCGRLEQYSDAVRKYWSKMWGINQSSCLLKIKDFSITTGMVQDPMHIFLEGIVPLVMSLFFYRVIVVEKWFSIKWLNTQISGFRYSYLHKNSKPEPTFAKNSEGGISVKQSSSAILVLCNIIPLIISSKIPKGYCYWINLLKLIQLVMICTSSYCSKDTPQLLRILVASFLEEYKTLYPKASFTPKLHYLVHLPRQMSLYGPLRHHWCMRFEAKHGFFKAKRYRNFKNLPLSMARQHQLYMAHRQIRYDGAGPVNFLYGGDLCPEGTQCNLIEKYPQLSECFRTLLPSNVPGFNHLNSQDLGQFAAYVVDNIHIHGLEYRTGCCLVKSYDKLTDCPTFCILDNIFVLNNSKYFIIELTEPAFFDTHTNHYQIVPIGRYELLPFCNLQFKWPLSVYVHAGRHVVHNSNSHMCESLEEYM